MCKQKLAVFLFVFLLLPLSGFALENNTDQETFMGKLSGFTNSFKSNGGYLEFGLRTGYISGRNTYDLDHHLSELEFPLNIYLGGGNLAVGYKDFSINSEFWGSLSDDPSRGWRSKDKDWEIPGQLTSDTKSQSDSNAVIWDANLRYDFFKHSFGKNETDEAGNKKDNLKLGVLVGYRYERFGYKDHGLYQTGTNIGDESSEVLVSEYKVKYHLPYYGLAVEAGTDKFGISIIGKYAFSPYAKDYDNHALRNPPLHFYGYYKKNPDVFIGDVTMFWRFFKGWQASLGADIALIRMDGTTWEEQHSPTHDNDQSIDTKQFLYWIGLGYRF